MSKNLKEMLLLSGVRGSDPPGKVSRAGRQNLVDDDPGGIFLIEDPLPLHPLHRQQGG